MVVPPAPSGSMMTPQRSARGLASTISDAGMFDLAGAVLKGPNDHDSDRHISETLKITRFDHSQQRNDH